MKDQRKTEMASVGRFNQKLHPVTGKKAHAELHRRTRTVHVDAFSNQHRPGLWLSKLPRFLGSRHSGNYSCPLPHIIIHTEMLQGLGHGTEPPIDGTHARKQGTRKIGMGIADPATIRLTGTADAGNDIPGLDIQSFGNRVPRFGLHGQKQHVARRAVLTGQILAKAGSSAYRVVNDRLADKGTTPPLSPDHAIALKGGYGSPNSVPVHAKLVGKRVFGRQLIAGSIHSGHNITFKSGINLSPQGNTISPRQHADTSHVFSHAKSAPHSSPDV